MLMPAIAGSAAPIDRDAKNAYTQHMYVARHLKLTSTKGFKKLTIDVY